MEPLWGEFLAAVDSCGWGFASGRSVFPVSAFSVATKSLKKTVGHYSIVCRKHFCDRAEIAHHHFAKEPVILSEAFIAC